MISSHRPPHRILLVAAMLATVVGIGCKETPTGDSAIAPGPPSLVGVNTGNAQSAAANSALPLPVTVRVYDANGHALQGVTVSWAPKEGSVTFATSLTDGSGMATNTWTVGKTAGTLVDTLLATASGANNSAIIAATVTAGSAATILKVSGDVQSVAVGTASSPLVVEAVDAFGNAVASAKVTWALAGGAGTLSATSTTSVAITGLTSITFTPTAAGANTITASDGTLTPVTFTLTGH